MSMEISLWLHCLVFFKKVSQSDNVLQSELFKYDARVDTDARNQLLRPSVAKP